VVDARLLSVYARGEQRFKVLRVRQVNPYLVVDAVPLADEGAGTADGTFASGGGGGGGGGGAFAMAASSFASTDASSSADEAGAGAGEAAAVAVALVAALERLKIAVGPARCCSPRHRMTLNSWSDGPKCGGLSGE